MQPQDEKYAAIYVMAISVHAVFNHVILVSATNDFSSACSKIDVLKWALSIKSNYTHYKVMSRKKTMITSVAPKAN